MKCREVLSRLERLAPAEYACDWDNPGFLVGRKEKEIQRVLVALDVTDAVVEQAENCQADLIISHHPLIFRPLRRLTDEDAQGRRLIRLIQNDISCFAMHTNFDIAPGCMAELAAKRLGLRKWSPLEVTGNCELGPVGVGAVGDLDKPLEFSVLAEYVQRQFELPFVTIYGMEQVKDPIARIAVSPGSGESMIAHALSQKAQVLITGDIGHHSGIDAAAEHMAIIDAGHYGLEHIFIPFVVSYLEGIGDISVVQAKSDFPVQLIMR